MCIRDSIVDLEKSQGRDIWRTGLVGQYDLSVSGGVDMVNYFVSGNMERSEGVDPDNALKRWGMRANVNVTPSEKWDIRANLNYITGRTDLGLEAGGGGITWSTYFARPDRC